jgi:cytochrome c oxidase cbb3-type subunit 4
MSYDALRHFADSWGLLFMGITFFVLIGWALRPSTRPDHERAARSILENDDG